MQYTLEGEYNQVVAHLRAVESNQAVLRATNQNLEMTIQRLRLDFEVRYDLCCFYFIELNYESYFL